MHRAHFPLDLYTHRKEFNLMEMCFNGQKTDFNSTENLFILKRKETTCYCFPLQQPSRQNGVKTFPLYIKVTSEKTKK